VYIIRRLLISISLVCLHAACSSSGSGPNTATGTAGDSGTAGSGDSTGSAGTTGAGGADATAGTSGTAGAGGDGGTTGSAGTTGRGGTSGTAGRGGTSGRGGTTGTAGTSGTAGTTGGGGATTAGQSVLERNKNPSRDAHFLQPTLTRAVAATLRATPGFTANVTGTMFASPLYLENGPNGKGVFFAATTSNDVYALDETTGAVVWKHNIGSAPQQSGAGCGDIQPIGIISTGVIDAASRTIFVAGAIGTSTISRHEVHALSVDDGSEKTGWPVDVSTLPASGGTTFMAQPANQRSALSLVGGIVYIGYGGHNGDCGPYHGWVIGINAMNPAMKGGWAAGGVGEGIWASGGMASDGNGVFATTGNANVFSSTHKDSEEVVRITGLGTRADTYYPSRWSDMDGDDADLGSSNPIYIELAGATPSKLVAQLSKDGHLYLLDAAALGGSNGHKVDVLVAQAGDSIRTSPAAYKTASGQYFVFASEHATKCPTSISGAAVVAVRIAAGNPPVPTVAWCAPMSDGMNGVIATTTNGTDNAIVWFSEGALVGLDGDTGAQIIRNGSCNGVERFSSPIAVKGRIIVGGDGHLCSWSAP
jgi:hypothetical protein